MNATPLLPPGTKDGAMKPGRRFYRTFLSETLEYQESQQIEPEVLENMVSRLREGDSSMIQPIIIGHLKMVMAIVADKGRSPRRGADIEGAAFLALVEAVHDCCPHYNKAGVFKESRLYDNKITYYISTTVAFAIKDEYGNDHVLRVSPRTIRDKISKGEKFEDIVPGDALELASDSNNDTMSDEGNYGSGTYALPFVIPIAKQEFPSLEFNEALRKCVENETERVIIRLRSEGYGYDEIGKRVGLSTPRIGQLVPLIEARFNRMYP